MVAPDTALPTFRIDGSAFADLEGFYDEVERALLWGAPWGRNLDAFNDILRGEFGPLPLRFRIIWELSDVSRDRLGMSGKGSFAELLEIIRDHDNVELVLA